MKIFEEAMAKFRKFNINGREKNLERLLARSMELGVKFETEAKKFGIDLRRLKTSNYYEALGIKYTEDHKIIKKAYHELMKKHHPDMNKEVNAEETTKKINEAYSVLKDRKLKEEYDKTFSDSKKVFAIEYNTWDTSRMSKELVRRYMEVREKDFKEFSEIISVPLQRDTLNAAIEEVCDWNKRFNKVATTTFSDFRDYGKKIKKLSSINRGLLQKETGEASLARLKENGRRLDELMMAYGWVNNGMSVVTGNVKKEIGLQESGITKKLRAMV
jgi:curved DNA-binding protein CbpA